MVSSPHPPTLKSVKVGLNVCQQLLSLHHIYHDTCIRSSALGTEVIVFTTTVCLENVFNVCLMQHCAK